MAKSTIWQVLIFFCWLSLGLVVWPRLCDLFVSQNPREVYASHSPGWIPSCSYTTCLYGQISILCTYYYYHYFAPYKFFTPALADGLLLESEWQQVSSSLQDTSQYSGQSVVWMVLVCPPIPNSFNLLTKPLEAFPSTPIIISITVTFMFHRFF